MKEEEIINVRLAAYFDFGGRVVIAKRATGYRLIVNFQTKRNEILDWISSQLQKKICKSQLSTTCMVDLSTKAKQIVVGHQARVRLYGVEAIEFIDRIEGYSIRHKEKFKIAHLFHDHYIVHFNPPKAHTPTEVAIAEECYQEMKALKRKNSKK